MSKPGTGTAPVQSLDDFEADSASLNEALCAGVGFVAPSRSQLERLLRRVDEMPLRFAPFFSRTAELFALNEAKVEALFSEFDKAATWHDSGAPGVKQFDVIAGKTLADTRGHFLRCAPGAHVPSHRHLGPESVLVLEGAYVDDQGTQRVAGQLHHMPAGTVHALRASDAGCTIAIMAQGVEFLGAKRPA
jgi:quercetin dioxygenase-like cupin family protein